MRVKFFVAYSESEQWPAPLNGIALPYFLAHRFHHSSHVFSALLLCIRDRWQTYGSIGRRRASYQLLEARVLSAKNHTQESKVVALRDDIDSIEPALNDAVNSSAFQITAWKSSDDPDRPVERSIMPAKLLRWVDKLDRLQSILDNKERCRRMITRLQPPSSPPLALPGGTYSLSCLTLASHPHAVVSRLTSLRTSKTILQILHLYPKGNMTPLTT